MMLKKNKVVYLPFLINCLLNGIPRNHYGKVSRNKKKTIWKKGSTILLDSYIETNYNCVSYLS